MRTDLSLDRARSALQELAASRLPSLTVPLNELRITETGALRLPIGNAELSEHARRQLACWLETSTEAIPTDGDLQLTALVNARLAAANDRVCLRIVRTPTGMLVRAIVESLRPTVGEELLAAVLGLLDYATAFGVERGSNHTLVTVRTGRRFDAGGSLHEHGLAISLDERGVIVTFAAVFLPGSSAPALSMVKAMRTDTSALKVAFALRDALDAELAREVLIRSALADLAPRPSLMAEVFLDHPAIPAETMRRVVARLMKRETATRYDVALEMLEETEALDVEARFAVAWRAGDLLLIDD